MEIKFWFALVLIGWCWTAKLQGETPTLQWKNKKVDPVFWNHHPLIGEGLSTFLKEYALKPDLVVLSLDSLASQKALFPLVKSSKPDLVWDWVLAELHLVILAQGNQWWVLPKNEVWKHQSYQQLILSPIPLSQVLNELSETGQIPIIYDLKSIGSYSVTDSLTFDSVKDTVEQLAFQFDLYLDYHSSQHRIRLYPLSQQSTQLITLQYSSADQLFDFWTKIFAEQRISGEPVLQRLTDSLILVQGLAKEVEQGAQMIRQWDLSQKPLESNEWSLSRYILNYRTILDQRIKSGGQELVVPGIQSSWNQILAALHFPKEHSPLEMVPDPMGNAILLRGLPEDLKSATELIQLWDSPFPLIQIEAHIFETSEGNSQKLGLMYGSTDPYRFHATLSPKGFSPTQLDATLSLMESEGSGRVLSRPIVVTMQNIQAEMNSGSIIHVKLSGTSDNSTKLREIETGVILRVTPRLISATESPNGTPQIQLIILAETSTPMEDERVDGIPQINRQRADSQVIVPSGNTFLLGGLVKHQQHVQETGIPWLKDIPFLGYLFKTESQSTQFDHILVFITPKLISSSSSFLLPPDALEPVPLEWKPISKKNESVSP